MNIWYYDLVFVEWGFVLLEEYERVVVWGLVVRVGGDGVVWGGVWEVDGDVFGEEG